MNRIELFLLIVLVSHMAWAGGRTKEIPPRLDDRQLQVLQGDAQRSVKTKEGANARLELAYRRIINELGDNTVDIQMATLMLKSVIRAYDVLHKFGALARLYYADMRIEDLIDDRELTLREVKGLLLELVEKLQPQTDFESVNILSQVRASLAVLDAPMPKEPKMKRQKPEPQVRAVTTMEIVRDICTMPALTDIRVDNFTDRVFRFFWASVESDELFRNLVYREMDRVRAQSIEEWYYRYDGQVNFDVLRLISMMFNVRFEVLDCPANGMRQTIYLGSFPELIRQVDLTWSGVGKTFARYLAPLEEEWVSWKPAGFSPFQRH